MKKHQIAAIVLGIILSIVSSLPVILAYKLYGGLVELGDPRVVKVFIYPTFGVAIAAIIIFISFFKTDKGD